MKKFYIGEEAYIVAPCAAIATEAGDTERQDAIYVASRAENGELFEFVYFGLEMPSTEDIAEFLEDDSCETSWKTIETVVFPDGTTPKDYVF